MLEILVVDDAAFDRAIAKKVFRALGNWHAEYASSGEEALSRMQEQKFDLILTDLHMPEMDGLELLSEIKKHDCKIPVVVMSSRGSEEAALQALRLGAANYVIKKQMIHDLPKILDSVMRSSRTIRMESAILDHLEQSHFRFVIPNDRELVQAAVSYMQVIAEKFGKLPEADRIRLGICLEESLLNAMIHGNLEVSSELRAVDEGSGYEKMIELRQKQQPYSDRRIEINASFSCNQLRFTILDEGPGFDVSRVPDPTTAENLSKPSGRGLMLMRIFMDAIEHNETGNQVTLIKNLAPPVVCPEASREENALLV